MNVSAQHYFDVLVVGGGPAGIAAAVCAAECGVKVGLVDDNAGLGGQIWRRALDGESTKEAATWSKRLSQADSIITLFGYRVFDQPESAVLLAEGDDDLLELHYQNLILATGARERFLPFPGWTLPNVMGAGGLQAMVKSGLPIRGERVVISGTGPLLLAVAAYLRKHGADIRIICEQTGWGNLFWFGLALSAYPGKVAQGLRLRSEIAGIPLAANSWPVAAHGREKLDSVDILREGKQETIACDYLACGFHLVPNIELQQLLGCGINGGHVVVNEFQETTAKGVFCAGEPTSIGGVDLALIEGQIAGLAAAGHRDEARRLFRSRKKARRFAQLLDAAFPLRDELRKLPRADTIVCRCEDVVHSRMQKYTSWRAAKMQTRCGMGPCQGRVCGPAAHFLYGWSTESVRPPVFPARVESLAVACAKTEQDTVTGGSK